jgi:YcaO-like protein with predicted kinase domain
MNIRTKITIQRVEQILKALDIQLEVVRKDNYYGMISSIAIRDRHVQNIAGSGAGFNEDDAYACALGELLERLQNGILYRAGVCEIDDNFKNVQYAVTNSEIVRRYKLGYEQIKMPYYEFMETSTNEKILVTEDYLKKCCGSVGMSAGSTNEESQIHGILEIVERYLIKCLFGDNPSKLSRGKIIIGMIKKEPILTIFERLKKEGYELYVYDYSITGLIPGVLSIIINTETGKFRCAVGVGNSTKTATERSLIDMFKGATDTEFFWPLQHINDFSMTLKQMGENTAKNYNENLMNSFSIGGIPGKTLESFFKMKINCDGIFFEGLEDLLKRIKTLGWEVFIRDTNTLGFPAHQVFIPNKSEINDPNDFKYHDLPRLRTLLYMGRYNIYSLYTILDILGKSAFAIKPNTKFISFLYQEMAFSKDDQQISFWQAVEDIQLHILRKIIDTSNNITDSEKAVLIFNLVHIVEEGLDEKNIPNSSAIFDIDWANLLGLPMRGECNQCTIIKNCRQIAANQVLKEVARMSNLNTVLQGDFL